MSSQTHGIRIFAKEKNILTFRVYLIYSDWKTLPRTHGFGYLVLISNWKKQNPLVNDQLSSENFERELYNNGKEYIKKLELTDFTNYPIHPDFTKEVWHYLDEKTGKFHAQDILPSALYTMEVADEKHLAHFDVGDVWETAHADIWFNSWYLEHKKDKKFYHLYQDELGKWNVNLGKLGTAGNSKTTYFVSWEAAERKMKTKLSKANGFHLVYQNYDTPFGLEEQIKSNDQKIGLTLVEALQENNEKKVKEILSTGINVNNCEDEYGNPLLESYITDIDLTDRTIDVDLLKLVFSHGVDPNIYQYDSYFHRVVASCTNEVIDLFIENGIVLENEDAGALFCAAVHAGNLVFLQRLIDLGLDINAKPGGNWYSNDANCLQSLDFCKQNEIEIIDFLLQNGLDINNSGSNRIIPLIGVMTFGKKEVVQHMLDKGADPFQKDELNMDAFENSSFYGNVENFEILANLNTTIAHKKAFKDVLQRLTISSPQVVIQKIKILMDLGVTFQNVHEPNHDVSISFHRKKSIKKYVEKALLELLELGLDPKARFGDYRDLLFLAVRLNSVVLLQKGFEINIYKSLSDHLTNVRIQELKEFADKCKAKKCIAYLAEM